MSTEWSRLNEPSRTFIRVSMCILSQGILMCHVCVDLISHAVRRRCAGDGEASSGYTLQATEISIVIGEEYK